MTVSTADGREQGIDACEMHAHVSGCVTGLVSSRKKARLVKKIAGTQVTDCKPKRPNWGMLSGGEVHSTTIAAWGHLVLLGDADGNLNKWDTTTSVHRSVLAALMIASPS